MQKFRFQYQFEGKGLENNFGPSVKLSDKKIQNGRQNPIWLPISSFLSQYPLITFVLLNINRDFGLYTSYVCMYE